MSHSTYKSDKPNIFYQRFNGPAFSRHRVWLHILFWSCYLIYEGLIWGMVDGEYWERFASTSIELPIKVCATYFTLYLLIDRLLIQKKYIPFIVALAISMVGFGIILRAVALYAVYPTFYPEGTAVPLLYFPKILISIFSIYSIVGTVAAFHVIMHWHRHQQSSQLMEKEKLESELQILKAQINPHFLFNTLNSLYVLTLNQSKSAPEIVHKLSELMSYMLYDSNQREVPLKKEIQYLENYIALERTRHESRMDISFNVYSNVENIVIAPLIILPFVENTFKHGAHHQTPNGFININISLKNTLMVLKIENSKDTEGFPRNNTGPGIGLQNVKKRLELIYPGRYDLQLFNEDESFLVILKLELDKNKVYTDQTVETLQEQ